MGRKSTYSTVKLDLTCKNLTDDDLRRILKKYPNLRVLDCSANQLTNLDYLPAKLRILICNANQITSLDYLPNNIQELYCSKNIISNLDHLPNDLQILYCHTNKITSLDHLPDGLRILDCYGNKIINLDHLPTSLQHLYCSCNQITKLDHLPMILQELYCNNTKITYLDYLPSGLEEINCLLNQFKVQIGEKYPNEYLPRRDEELLDEKNNNCHIIRSRYLRFLRNCINTRKTHAFLALRELRNKSQFYENCLPVEVIKHIVGFI